MKIESYYIVSYLNSFEFPLREATRKEVWWEAQNQKRKGYDVSIIIVGDSLGVANIKEGISIIYIDHRSISSLNADIIHCLTGSISLSFPFFKRAKSKRKILTLTDGWMLGYNKILLRRLVAKFLFKWFDEVNVYSEYQKKLLSNKRIKVVKPYLPILTIPDVPKEEVPTVLYMGHISESKGFNIIIPALRRLLSDDKRIRFIVANNMIQGDVEYLEEVKRLEHEFKNRVIIKGVVDPLVELKRAWVYIYPFNTPIGTMAFPLSLFEAQQCGTPFVACDVSANSEFFDNKYLIKPNEEQELYERIKYFIDEREIV